MSYGTAVIRVRVFSGVAKESRLRSGSCSFLCGPRFGCTDSLGTSELRDTSDGRHTYSYDALNRVASFVSTESRVYTFSYDADSRRTTVNYGTGDRLTAYDALSRVVTQVERVGGSPILTIVDAFDSAGRKISQLRDAVLTSYTYDSADRLTGQQVSGAFATFTMDAVGNITVKRQQGSDPITMTYNAGSRLVTSVEGAVVSTYTFDANGNQTAVNAGGSRTTYAYDYENRMRTAIDPGGARSTLAYWADGMRRFLEVGGTRTTFVWDGSDYLQSRTPSEVTTFSTVDAQILDSETGGSESLLVPDPLGSVVKVLDASGNQVYDATYWPYGEIRDSVGVNDTSWGYVGTWGYHFDTSRRLYIRARVLDPVTGRWYSVDPLWPAEWSHLYADNSPTGMIDPRGTKANDCRSRTVSYCQEALKHPSNSALRCFCRVSYLLCNFLIRTEMEDIETRRCYNCINKCLFDHWEKRNSSASGACWSVGTDPDARKCLYGGDECMWSIRCEQKSLTGCTGKECKSACPRGIPAPKGTPGGKWPFPFSGSEAARIKRGQELCCDPGNVGKVDAGIVPIYFPIEKWG